MGLLDLIFPKRCVACGRLGDYLCREDAEKITSAKSFCPVCQKGAVGGTTHARCKQKLSLDGLICIFDYGSPIKELIHEMKYRFVQDLQTVVQKELTKMKQLDGYDFKGFELLPIPQHKKRENWRGFNQTEILGKLVAKRLKITPQTEVLAKAKETKPQVELKRKERLKQMSGAFALEPAVSVLGKKFIIFDDVWTTGATLKAAASVLKRKGAAKVWGVAFASSH